MNNGWIMEELQTADLRDKRLETRLVKLLDTLSQNSTASIPAACTDRAEMVAAYRFFDNEKIDFESVLAPHIDATCERVAQQSVALLVQDTTELDLTRPTSKMQGAGPLHSGRRCSKMQGAGPPHSGRRCGALLHPLMAFTTAGNSLRRSLITPKPYRAAPTLGTLPITSRRLKKKKVTAGLRRLNDALRQNPLS
jgi:hypothetical protein